MRSWEWANWSEIALQLRDFASRRTDRRVTAITSRLPPGLYRFAHVGPEEECDMIADWIVIYAVLFVLCAAVVSGVPSKG